MKTFLLGLVVVVAVAIVAFRATSEVVAPVEQEQEQGLEQTQEKSAGIGTLLDDVRETVGAPDAPGAQVEIYNGISFPKNTDAVDLSGRGLSGSLKAEVRHLSNLRELDLSDNDFTGLPAEVGQLSKLEVLNLSNNPFTGLPYELGNLSNLKVLDLRDTNYAVQDLEIIKQSLPASAEVLTD